MAAADERQPCGGIPRRNQAPASDMASLVRSPSGLLTTILALVLPVAVASGVYLTAASQAGLFHDDAVYMVNAKAIADGRGFRTVSVPTEPFQTKYPILYPLLLAGIWKIAPNYPDNVAVLRLVGTVSMVAFLVGATMLKRELGSEQSALSTAAFVIALGCNPLVASLSTMVLSDMLFAALCVAMWVAHLRVDERRRLTMLLVTSACLAVSALATRRTGVAFVLAGAVWAARQRRWSTLVTYAGIVAMVTWVVHLPAPWSFATSNPLLDYYASYETGAFLGLLREPVRALRIAGDNVIFAAAAVSEFVVPSLWRPVSWMLASFALIGGVATASRAGTFMSTSVVVYLLIVLFYPFMPTRYLLPIAPLVILAIFNGASLLYDMITRALVRIPRFLVLVAVSVPIAALVLTTLGWSRWNYGQAHASTVRLWTGLPTRDEWSGFQETIDWIRGNTNTHDVLASAYDPMYYLYTGRQGVRPWMHHPETYFYPRHNRHPFVGEASDIRQAMDKLAVSYLVVDPLEGFAEGPAVSNLFGTLLEQYGARATLAFETSDKRHRVYRLASAPE